MNEIWESRTRGRTTWVERPIWELELIVSGAVIVGLFQIPSLLTAWFEATAPHLSARAFWLPYLVFYLGMTALVGLIVVFAVHFAVRCLWVSILGLRNAFPSGIDWEKIDLGPLQKEFYRQRSADLSTLETRLDRLASSLFASLFVIVVYVLLVALMMALTFAISWLLRLLWPTGGRVELFFVVALGVITLPLVLAGLVVQIVDSRLARDPSFAERHPVLVRITRRLLGAVAAVALTRLYQPVVMTLRSRISNTRFLVLSNALAILFAVLVIVVVFVSMGLLRADSYRYFPDWPGIHGYDPDHYATHRTADSEVGLPWIQSDLVDRPFVRLFLPFRARTGNEIVREHCPDVEPFHVDGLRGAVRRNAREEPPDKVARAVECLRRLFEIELNGEPVDEAEPLLADDPVSGVKGLVMIIAGKSIAVGRNQLRVSVQQRPAAKDPDDPLARAYQIPFWFVPAGASPGLATPAGAVGDAGSGEGDPVGEQTSGLAARARRDD